MLTSLAEQGFRQLVIWRGCGQHALDGVAERFNQQWQGRARAIVPESPFHDIWMRLGNPNNPGGHADAFMTSLVLYLRREAVRKERIVDPLTHRAGLLSDFCSSSPNFASGFLQTPPRNGLPRS